MVFLEKPFQFSLVISSPLVSFPVSSQDTVLVLPVFTRPSYPAELFRTSKQLGLGHFPGHLSQNLPGLGPGLGRETSLMILMCWEERAGHPPS